MKTVDSIPCSDRKTSKIWKTQQVFSNKVRRKCTMVFTKTYDKDKNTTKRQIHKFKHTFSRDDITCVSSRSAASKNTAKKYC